MSDSQSAAAPQNPTETPVQTDPKATQPQGAGAPSAAGGQAGAGTVAEAAKEAMRKHKLKVDGQEIEVDEEELKRGYGLQKVSTKRMQEATATKKQAEEFISMMKDKGKVFEVLQKLGHDPRKLTEEFLAEKIKYEMMDPKDRDLLEAQRERDALLEEKKSAQAAKDKEATDKLTKHYVEKYNKEIIEALSDTPIPQNKESVSRMAEYISKYAKVKIPITAKEAAILVQQDIEAAQTRIYQGATPEQLLKLLGEEGVQKLRAYDVSKLKSPEQHLLTPQGQPETGTRKRSSSTGRYTPSEWRLHKRGLL
jgi:hypothetical protein